MAYSQSCRPPSLHARRKAALTIFLLAFFYIQTSVAAELNQDGQQHEELETALSDIDSAVPVDKLSAIELEENTWFQPQTEWRSEISTDAANAFAAAVAAQRAIKEVILLC